MPGIEVQSLIVDLRVYFCREMNMCIATAVNAVIYARCSKGASATALTR